MDLLGAQRARAYLAAVERRDTEAILGFFDDDVVLHVAGDHPWAGSYEGPAGILRWFQALLERTEGSLTVEEDRVLASDTHAAVFARVRGRRGDLSFDVMLLQSLRTGESGRWDKYFAMVDDQAAVDAFMVAP